MSLHARGKGIELRVTRKDDKEGTFGGVVVNSNIKNMELTNEKIKDYYFFDYC